jgi:hypothetical protein
MSARFWKEGFDGMAKGGYYLRNDLFKFFAKLKEDGKEPVAIEVDDDWNLEIFVKGDK